MLDVAPEVKAKLKSDVCNKELTITVGNVICGNEDIYNDSFSLEEAVMDSTVEFVGCISSIMRAKISTLKLPKANYAGTPVTATLEVWLDAETISETIPLFIGYIDSCQKSADGHWQEIVCYDTLAYLTETPVYNHYKAAFNGGSKTIGYFREYILAALGIPGETQTLCNDAVTFRKRFRNKDMTALALLRHICQINGAYGIINRDGNFEYRQIDDEAVPESVPYYRELKYSNAPINPVHNAITIRQSSQDAGVTITRANYQQYAGTDPGWTDESQDDYLVDDDDEDIPNENYVIEGNLIAHKLKKSKKQVMAANIMASLGSDTVFREHRVVCNGLPYLECCDKVVFTKADSTQIEFIITKRTLKGVQNMTDTFECTPTQEYDSGLDGGGSHTVSATKASYVSNIGTSTKTMTGAAEQNGLPVLINKDIYYNGTFEAELDGADGYAQVTVRVPTGGDVGGYPVVGTAEAFISPYSTVYINRPDGVSARIIQTTIPSGSDVGYRKGIINFHTTGSSLGQRGLYSLSSEFPNDTPTLVMATTARTVPTLNRSLMIIKKMVDGHYVFDLCKVGETEGEVRDTYNQLSLNNMSANYNFSYVNNRATILSIDDASVVINQNVPEEGARANYAIGPTKCMSLGWDSISGQSYVHINPMTGSESFYMCGTNRYSYNNLANRANYIGGCVIAQYTDNGIRYLDKIPLIGPVIDPDNPHTFQTTPINLFSSSNMTDINWNAEGSKIWVGLGNLGLLVLNPDFSYKIYSEVTSINYANACMFENYFWDGSNLWELEPKSGYTIGPTKSKFGGDMLGYVKDSINMGAIGVAYVLFD